MIKRSWHSADQIEEENPKSKRHVEGTLQCGHLANDHQWVPDGVAKRSRHHYHPDMIILFCLSVHIIDFEAFDVFNFSQNSQSSRKFLTKWEFSNQACLISFLKFTKRRKCYNNLSISNVQISNKCVKKCWKNYKFWLRLLS